jgi:hypothetical protein
MPPIRQALREAIVSAGWDTAPREDPRTSEDYLGILAILHATGRRDLPLGRLLEGHVDAVQIAFRFGTADQRARLREGLAAGLISGVWNAALPGETLKLDDQGLHGGKAYASGAGVLTSALVTAETADGPQLILLDLEQAPPDIDTGWWRTTGMQRSETHIVRWNHQPIGSDTLIGAPGAYSTEPFFSSGALRFAAVQAGGIAGLFDRTRDHLLTTNRAGDPFQAARLAQLFELADGAAGVVRRTAERSFTEDNDARIARVGAARSAVSSAAERALKVAQQAVGLPGMFIDHPLSANLSDLAVYLRQPAPDAQRLRVGRAVAEGVLSLSL